MIEGCLLLLSTVKPFFCQDYYCIISDLVTKTVVQVEGRFARSLKEEKYGLILGSGKVEMTKDAQNGNRIPTHNLRHIICQINDYIFSVLYATRI